MNWKFYKCFHFQTAEHTPPKPLQMQTKNLEYNETKDSLMVSISKYITHSIWSMETKLTYKNDRSKDDYVNLKQGLQTRTGQHYVSPLSICVLNKWLSLDKKSGLTAANKVAEYTKMTGFLKNFRSTLGLQASYCSLLSIWLLVNSKSFAGTKFYYTMLKTELYKRDSISKWEKVLLLSLPSSFITG